MRRMSFAQAIEDALAKAMARDDRIVLIGEDIQMIRLNLLARFGEERLLDTPISEGAFLGAGVTAAMAGLRPIVEIMLVDFIGVAMDALLNHAAKVKAFSGGQWNVPLVIRAACGGGYGDGGQHEQCLWGWFAHIPGLSVVVPSNPADAGGLMLSAIEHDDPVIYLEHKLLADYWLDFLGTQGRDTVKVDVPANGERGLVPAEWEAIPLGKATVCCAGNDVTIVSIGVGVHQSLEAATRLERDGLSIEVIDLRTIKPLDTQTLVASVRKTGRLVVVDEDYKGFGLSGEIAACLLEEGLTFKYSRVCTEHTIPYARTLEYQTLPHTEKVIQSVQQLFSELEKTSISH